MLNRLFDRLFPRAKSARFGASAVSDANITQGTDWNAVYRDRYNYQRDTVLNEALLAWRLNPLARRIVTITRQYITDSIEFDCDHEHTKAFLVKFWNDPLNRIGSHLGEWCDELALTGNLFPILTTDSAGMSYLRVFPTDQVKEIHTAENDVQQETAYEPKPSSTDTDPAHIANYYKSKRAKTVMLHFAVNKLAGMKWGEPDIAPLLPWLARYASWLEDRVRLNRFRQAFLYVIKGKFNSLSEKQARQKEVNANPPSPGSVLVTDDSETWEVINPKLDSFEAGTDGLAVKKFIAAGQGIPMHWLAEPEGSTRTTAEAAGTPTFKTLEDRQRLFLSMLKEILQITVTRRAAKGDSTVDPKATITVTAADISERDNAALALASTQVITSFGQLWANGFIDDDEYMRVVYRFAGEVLPASRPDNPAKPIPKKPANDQPGATSPSGKVDTDSGDVSIESDKKVYK